MAWVMNQDKIAIVDVSSLNVDIVDIVNTENADESKRTKAYRVWGQSADHDYLMGAYKTLEKAQEVMAAFASNIVNPKYVVFEMPKDDSGCEA